MTKRKLFGIQVKGILDEDLTAAWVRVACEKHTWDDGSVTVTDLTPEWISVKYEARLPKDGKDVWVGTSGKTWLGFWDGTCWLHPDGEHEIADVITHWQEITNKPEPPA